ncbi:unnamed protein product [Plasmodium vivax]|uniref:(malaria parasite P. vivax) hypothetical protein n=1 Tax=Plasmodium vivax TaxID=5855 RepID=A0A8S4HMY1_PLAVI|nr:unnamed protein product [Plasmodium vivax]
MIMAGTYPQGTFGTDSFVLFSENFYNNMNKEHDDLSDYSKYCDITWGKNEHKLKEICKKYIRYLETSNELNFVNSAYDVCILLNYWTYVKLTEIFGLENSLDDIELAFGNLQYVWNQLYHYTGKRFNHNNCKPNFETNNHIDWVNRKKLYDYYVDYYTLFTMARILDDNCKYYKRIKEMQTVFDYFDSHCATYPDKCPPIYSVCQSYNPKNVLSTLPCHTQMEQAKSAAPVPGEDYNSDASEGSKPTYSDLGGGPAAEIDTQLESGNSDVSKKVTHSILGAAPVLFTATMLYRYTPLGPWIRRFRGGRTNNINAMDGVQSYMQETGDIFSNNDANYISYQPM